MYDIPPCIRDIGLGRTVYACDRTECHASTVVRVPCAPRKLAAGRHVFVQGDPQIQVFLVREGAVRLYKLLRNGRRQIIGFKFASDFINLSRDPKHRLSAQAITDVELRAFPATSLHAIAANEPRILSRLFDAVTADLTRAQDLTVTVGQRDADGCVAAFLLDLDSRASARGEDADIVPLPMLRSDIADYLGLSLETVSRIFTSFRKRKLIETVGLRAVRLVNRTALRAQCDLSAADRHARMK